MNPKHVCVAITIFVVIQIANSRPLPAQQSSPAHACTDPSINNFQHAPGVQTGSPGLAHVEKRGSGSIPLILIPGAAFDWTIWDSFMQRNAAHYTMYAVTPAGYGGTPPPPIPAAENFTNRTWSDALVRDIADLVQKEKLDRPVIVGHHMMGDYYAIRMALEHGDRIGGVIILCGSPTFAVPAYGANKPGAPVKLADSQQRLRSVQAFFAPFYKCVTPEMWRSGSFQARRFCKDQHRARHLFEQQIAVPIPTQVRYFLEYLTADPAPDLANCSVPFLVMLPKQQWTLDKALDAFRESNEMMYGKDPAVARTAWTRNFQAGWGDVDAGIRWSYDLAFQWEQLLPSMKNLTIKQIPGARIFMMEDQPDVVDTAIRAFTTELHRKPAASVRSTEKPPHRGEE